MGGERQNAELREALAGRDSPAVREAELLARNSELAERNRALEEEVRQLKELIESLRAKLSENSRNSGRPPSSDGPGARKNRPTRRKKNKSGNKRGAQKGHEGQHRKLLPVEEVDHVFDLFPPTCGNCEAALPAVHEARPMRHQVTELPEPRPEVTEFRCHAVQCFCGHRTRAGLDRIGESAFGPRLSATIALLTGVYHLSRRTTRTVAKELFGVDISLGGISGIEARVSKTLESSVDEAWKKVQASRVKYTDGTTWLGSGMTMQLWTIAAACATVFRVLTDATANTLRPLFGARTGTMVSDRASALYFWAMEARQICWAHLLRRFISFSERDGSAGAHGQRLLEYTELLFEYWHAYKDRELSRTKLIERVRPVRRDFEAELERVVAKDIRGMSGSCLDILHHRKALWTFVEEDGIEPTNNHAERELSSFVLWRKKSFGAQSERGHLFAERIMTVAHTARKQERSVLNFVTETCKAWIERKSLPSLFSSEG